jgi:hypothetical protein
VLPDEDDGLLDELGELANEAILVETLMGWDGEACACEACNCARFRDGDQDGRCTLCRAGNHTP